MKAYSAQWGIAALVIATVLGACGKDQHQCSRISPDQQGSFFKERLESDQKVEVLIDNGPNGFTDEQQKAIALAVSRANDAAHRVGGGDLFTVRITQVPGTVLPKYSGKGACDTFTGDGEQFVAISRVDSDSKWAAMNFPDIARGGTVRCTRGDSIEKQAVFINTQLKDTSAAMVTAIAGHELFHVRGLDHSCSGDKNNPDYVSCDNVKSNSNPYYQALMFPVVSRDIPSVDKSFFQKNDIDRLGCLFE